MYTRHDAYELHIKGLVQGVGFRPFVYRMARRYGIQGSVSNRNDGVCILAEGSREALKRFEKALHYQKPQAASIQSIERKKIHENGFYGFSIGKSSVVSQTTTEVSPDIAVCPDCLKDLKDQKHRIRYPFINCTHCGPRFTIIREIPYDRATTSMDRFPMCPQCREEFHDVKDRRFHAQPVACAQCGPQYHMGVIPDPEAVIPLMAKCIQEGGIAALKGLGGFHLLCDAWQPEAVHRLRQYKQRDTKPFALLCRSLETLRQRMHVSHLEAETLTSWRRPIVLLNAGTEFFPEARAGMFGIGVLLPYMPIQHLLFEQLDTDWLICTSGNLSGMPLWISSEEVKKGRGEYRLQIADHNRDIVNRADDSVVQVIDTEVHIVRRSRGFVPSSIPLSVTAEGILALGAELTGAFAMGKAEKAFMSQYIGDLKNYETFRFYEESLERFRILFRFEPGLVACDMHPDYLTTRLAYSYGLPVVQVQHHHAHVAACCAEHHLKGPVIGLSMDGTGYGTDGTVWGGEVLYCENGDFERIMHFEPLPAPGGDKVSEEPWRMALACLYRYCPEEISFPFRDIPEEKTALVRAALERNVYCPRTSSCGRLFDAVAALTGICTQNGYQAQAPLLLEAQRTETAARYSWNISESLISFAPMFREILKDVAHGTSAAVVSGKFHNTMVESLAEATHRSARMRNIQDIVLSGGCFQNRFLMQELTKRLRAAGMKVYYPRQVPCNDGGIALGQMYVAAKKRDHYVS